MPPGVVAVSITGQPFDLFAYTKSENKGQTADDQTSCLPDIKPYRAYLAIIPQTSFADDIISYTAAARSRLGWHCRYV
jgi:hypothetical protein